MARYPSHRAFVEAWTPATDVAVKTGSVPAADAAGLEAAAAQSPVGG
jgi:hypothetical protein